MGTASIAVVGLVNEMSRDLGVSKPAIAALVTVFALTFAIAAPFVQIAAGRLPRRTLLLAGLATLAAGCLATSLVPDYPGVVAARLLMAFGACAVGPVASSLGASLVPAARQGHALAVVFGGMTLATVLGVPVSTWLGTTVGWRWVFAMLALTSGLTAVTIAALVRERSPAPAVTLASFTQVFRHPAATWAVTMALFHMAAQMSMYALVTPYLQERFAIPAHWLSATFLIAGVCSVAGNLLAGRLVDRLGASRTIVLAFAGFGAVFVALAFAPVQPWIGVAGFAAWSVSGIAFYAPQQKRLIALAPQLGGLLLAMNASAIYIGMSLGSAAAGQAYLRIGVQSLPFVALAFLAAAAVAFDRSHRAAMRDA
jgi:DHA1 family inner membrane transport protein